jgi:hypothetical protein
MIDINLNHAAQCVNGFEEDWLQYKGWHTEFYALDLTDREQALYAIRKWLIANTNAVYPEAGRYQWKEACRYCLTKELGWANVWLPGIDGDASFKPHDMEHWKREMQKFYLLLWSELFPDDPFRPADLSQYRQRVDVNFANFPHMPELWGEPEYRP